MRWLNDRDLLVASIPKREVFRQVGWLGQSGKFYDNDGEPAKHEPGSFTPIYIHLESEEMHDVSTL